MSTNYIPNKQNLSIKNDIKRVVNDHIGNDELSNENIKFSDIKSKIYKNFYNESDKVNSTSNESFPISSVVNSSDLSVQINVRNSTGLANSDGSIRIIPSGGSGQYKLEFKKELTTINYRWETSTLNTKPKARWYYGGSIRNFFGKNNSCENEKSNSSWIDQTYLIPKFIKNTSNTVWPYGFYYRITNLGITDDIGGINQNTGDRNQYNYNYNSYSAGPFGAFIYGVSQIEPDRNQPLANLGYRFFNYTPSQKCANGFNPATSGILRDLSTNQIIWEISNWVYGYGGRDDNFNILNPSVPSIKSQNLVSGIGDTGIGRNGRIYMNLSSYGAARGGTIYYRKPVQPNQTIQFWVILKHPCHPDKTGISKCYNGRGSAAGPGFIDSYAYVSPYFVYEKMGPVVAGEDEDSVKQELNLDSNNCYVLSDVLGDVESNDNNPCYFWLTDLITNQVFKFVVRVGTSTKGAWAGITYEDFQLPTTSNKRFFDNQITTAGNFSKKITLRYPGKDEVYAPSPISDSNESGGQIFW